MLTDIFSTRYPEQLIWGSDGLPENIATLLRQLTHIVAHDILAQTKSAEGICKAAHDQLARELGLFRLEVGETFLDSCSRLLTTPYNLWNNSHRTPDFYFKSRLSIIELLLREVERRRDEARAAATKETSKLMKALGVNFGDSEDRLRKAIDEINARSRDAGFPFHFHSGVFQRSDDSLTSSAIAEPFWALLSDPAWANVDLDIKEAIDRRDTNGRDAALYALKALESTIKIVSDGKGLTRGSEKGAANYIDNLVSSKNGRVVDVWEADILKQMFASIRNPHGHGPGKASMPSLSEVQQTWVIDSAMAWIKSLVRRA